MSYSEKKKLDCVNIVKILLEKTIKNALNIKDDRGKTALQLAIENNCNEITRMIAFKMSSKPDISHSNYHLKHFLPSHSHSFF